MNTKLIKRELQVAFSKRAQPLWFRITKYCLFIFLGCMLWNGGSFGLVFSLLIIASLCLHFWYRYKTRGWTKSYGFWKPEHSTHE
ncbi:hypothetical protein ACFQZS_15840 [Mucilaginibacter calamicampi]|uniref:Transmembrane protein n=1 Tax=Mucilaginibacter calamicampi TaxID=1302352 RepID=A0ABW2Z280_9SPHI